MTSIIFGATLETEKLEGGVCLVKPLLLICLGVALLYGIFMMLRKASFGAELKEYETYIKHATDPSIRELRRLMRYENPSGGSIEARVASHFYPYTGPLGKPSWYEMDKYRVEERIGSMFRSDWRGWDESVEDSDFTCTYNLMEGSAKRACETAASSWIEDGAKFCAERMNVYNSWWESNAVCGEYFSQRDRDKLRASGYVLTRNTVEPMHSVLYCLDVFERNGSPCLFLTDRQGHFGISDNLHSDGQYNAVGYWVQGILSYPLCGISMEEAKLFKNRILYVDGVLRDEYFLRAYPWEDAEMIYHGINPFFEKKLSKDFEIETDWKDPHNEDIKKENDELRSRHALLKGIHGPEWTKKDTAIRLGLSGNMDAEELPEKMRIDWRGNNFMSEKKMHLLPNFDIMRIRVTPFTLDGVIGLKEYLKNGCPVYEFSMYGVRAWEREPWGYYLPRRRKSSSSWKGEAGLTELDECSFDDVFAVKVDKEVLENHKMK